MNQIDCKQCGGPMHKTKHVDANRTIQALGCITLILGIVLLFLFPVGTIIGAIMILMSFGMGYKRRKVWKCKQCGYFFEHG